MSKNNSYRRPAPTPTTTSAPTKPVAPAKPITEPIKTSTETQEGVLVAVAVLGDSADVIEGTGDEMLEVETQAEESLGDDKAREDEGEEESEVVEPHSDSTEYFLVKSSVCLAPGGVFLRMAQPGEVLTSTSGELGLDHDEHQRIVERLLRLDALEIVVNPAVHEAGAEAEVGQE